jgi:hypothetical protein
LEQRDLRQRDRQTERERDKERVEGKRERLGGGEESGMIAQEMH